MRQTFNILFLKKEIKFAVNKLSFQITGEQDQGVFQIYREA